MTESERKEAEDELLRDMKSTQRAERQSFIDLAAIQVAGALVSNGMTGLSYTNLAGDAYFTAECLWNERERRRKEGR